MKTARTSIAEAVATSLKAITTRNTDDAAIAALALRYAEELDLVTDPRLIADLGSKLQACLTELGLTPRQRAGLPRPSGANPLSKFRGNER